MSSACLYDDTNKLGKEKSEEIFKEWGRYWQVLEANKKFDGFVNITHGTNIDWKNGKNETADCETDKKDVNKGKSNDDSDRRWLFAMRHGERVDITYGEWVRYCFDESGNYVRGDLNMPVKLGERVGGKDSYAKDTPLTRVGQLQAQLVGEGLRLAGVPVRHVYASAALRCVETAQALLNGLQPGHKSIKIKVEPGLFECKVWHEAKGLAPFMTPEEFDKAGFDVDLSYKPYIDLDVKTTETLDDCYNRVEKVMQSAYKDTAEEGGNIMFVGHSTTLDMLYAAMKRLDVTDQPQRPYKMNVPVMFKVPYCGLAAVKDKPWEVVQPPCPPAMNSSNGRFDWTMLTEVSKDEISQPEDGGPLGFLETTPSGPKTKE